MEIVLFWILAVGAVACALLVILPPLARNPLYSAIALIGSFLSLAGLYALLSVHLVAVLQVLVYAGAIMVLFVFVIMLLNLREHELKPSPLTPARVVGTLAGVFVMVRLAFVAVRAVTGAIPVDLVHPVGETVQGEAVMFGTIKHVGGALFTTWLVPFELVSVLLLVAILGAVVLGKRRLGPAPEAAPSESEARSES